MKIKHIKDASEHLLLIQSQMPHIACELNKRWGYVSLSNYIAAILFDTRNDTRAGFPPDIVDAMLAISKANTEEHNLHRFQVVPIVTYAGEWSMDYINQ